METKQVIVMRKDLNMRKGKMIAQGAHASMKVFLDKMKQVSFSNGGGGNFLVHANDEMADWMKGRFTKVCVYVESEQALLELYNKAQQKKLPCALVKDAGLTEFGGVPTNTCIAIGPANSSSVDDITGTLPLL